MFNKYSKKQDGIIRFYDMHSKGTKIATILIFIACLAMIIASLFPAIWVFFGGFKNIKEFRLKPTILPESFDIGGYIKTWTDFKFMKYYINSMISVLGSVVCAVIFNGLLAYSLSILKPKGGKIIFGVVLWSLLIPATTSVVALYVNINSLGLNHSFIPLWLSFGANAFYVVLFKEFFDNIPKEYVEAATLDGCSSLKIFYMIIMPISKSIIVVVCIFAVTAAWSDFLLPYLVLAGSPRETVMVRLFQFRTSNATDVEILRSIVFSIIPPTILFIIFQKQITDGAFTGGIKG